MANIGPFPSGFVFPGVYTQTFDSAPTGIVTPGARIPVFIGIGSSSTPVSAYEVIRGSSAMADNPITKEDVSYQFSIANNPNGNNRTINVTFYPIVTGSGAGITTTDPSDVTVYDNGISVPVASIDGSAGQIYLVNPPQTGDTVTVSYYFKRTDTLYTNENVSAQANGTNLSFQVGNGPIVTGENGGIVSTNPANVTVTVNGVGVVPTSVNGAESIVVLPTAPLSNATVLITYYGNSYQYTYDILPPNVLSITNVGLNSTSTDFIRDKDYELETGVSIIDNTNAQSTFNIITWGNSNAILPGIITSDFTSLAAEITTALDVDTRIFAQVASPINGAVDGTNDGTNKTFVLAGTPVSGSGQGISTDNTSTVSAYVGANPFAAVSAGPVPIATLTSATDTIVLQNAPAQGNHVYVTQYENFMTDNVWTLSNLVTDGSTFSVVNSEDSSAFTVLFDSSSISNLPYYPQNGASNLSLGNVTCAVVPPATGINNEVITTTFIDSTQYVVSSNVAGGTGSIVADATGYVNQTYIDPVTGFRITLGSVNPSTSLYSAGMIFKYLVTSTFTASSSNQYGIPGIKFVVSSLTNYAGDTGIINTYVKSGNEPAVGDFYYISFLQGTQFNDNGIATPVYVTTEKDALNYSGPLSASNKLSLAAHLAFLNGTGGIILCQIQVPSGQTDAPDSLYMSAIDLFNTPLPGGLRGALIQPVTTSINVINYLRTTNSQQSSIRYANERMSYFGFPLNTSPSSAIVIAQSMNSERMIAIYPDGALMSITDSAGNTTSFLVDGSLVAAAVAGIDTAAAYDVAEPLERKQISGFISLYRNLDAVTQAQVANAGITLLDNESAGIIIKMDLTTDLTSVLTQIPSVIRIKDYVQQGVRLTLNQFIGGKFLNSRTGDIEVKVKSFFSALQKANIIAAFASVTAVPDPDEPTTVNVTATYSPVFPLRWIVVTFSLVSTI
jgi:hypothetical protein